MNGRRPQPTSSRPRILIAGGGVAGLETLLALRAFAGDRIDITMVTPQLAFRNESMAVDAPFHLQRGRGIRLETLLAEFGARWVRTTLDLVEPERRVAVTRDSEELGYDSLVLALGARPVEWASRSLFDRDGSHALRYRGGRDNPDYRRLLDQMHSGQLTRLAFVKPGGPSWPLPLYDLALLTAADCAARDCDVELNFITPEEEPLGLFGRRASAAVGRLLTEHGVSLHTASYGRPIRPGVLEISPGDRKMQVDRIVTEPRLRGPRLRGLPCDPGGFLQVDLHGRVLDIDDVYAAGDATSFPVKQGGLAAQQADAAAASIAASAGIDIDPDPFRPVLRGLLLTGGPPRFLRSDISGGAGDDSTATQETLWWPPNKLAGRYLGPYLSNQIGEASDVMPREHGIVVETELDHGSPDNPPELADLSHAKPG